MYPVSLLYADYLNRRDRMFKVKALINDVEYDNTVIVDFTVENQIVSADEFEVGTVIPSKLTITLRTQDIIPANAKVKPYLSLDLGGMTWVGATYPWDEMDMSWTGATTEWIPVGEFYVDTREKVNDVWTYTCLDKLAFANAIYISSLTYPATQKAVFDEICGRLGYTYDSSVVINPGYQVQAGPTGFSQSQMLGYIASANHASVFMGKDGVLRFRRYSAADAPVFNFTATDYIRTPTQTNPIKTYTRVVVTYDTDDDLFYEAGDGDSNHTLYITNPFATQAMTNDILAALDGFSYQPISSEAIGVPHLDQGDIISYEADEGRSWIDSMTPWESTDVPWNGITKHQTILLHQTISFKGGLKMSFEAPSASEQQSEFPVVGPLTQAVNDLNKTAIKEGKVYFGTTITRTDGLIIEREDHKSKLTLNSDVMDWQVNGSSSLYYDAQANRLKFTGTLEAADGIFSGDLQAAGGTFSGDLVAVGGTFTGTLVGVDGSFSGTITASTITGSNINGTTITGSTIKTSASGRRLEITTNGLRSYDSGNHQRIVMATTSDDDSAAIVFFDANGNSPGEINAYQSSGLTVFSNNLFLGSNNTANPITMQGSARFNGPAIFNSSVSGIRLNISDVIGLQEQLNNISFILNNHVHQVTTANHNHGNPQNQPNTGGGTYTTTTP